ncbi:MAG: hypothetical protein CVU29_01825 [Betaproteobacteria bacterium HGW-Betaproteobacteria-22]|nr:MAG: hypothetical protein CVU29_01825 [Betaproteobacteria bacterium HGW-Betaproteobacteria-22]
MIKVITQYLVALLFFAATPVLAGEAYIQPVAKGWDVRPIITVGESAINGYKMVGVPDGLGAFNNGDGSMTVLMNHELNADIGVVRAHGAKGAFVSRWIVGLNDLAVLQGEDLVKKVQLWDASAGSYHTGESVTFGRFCSADLAHGSAFLDADGNGFDGKILLNGEEEKDLGGRALAHIASGQNNGVSYELPHLGRVAWENLLALPNAGKRTVVIGMDDFPGGHVYVYVGEKRRIGNPAEKAGLVGGALYTVKFEGERFALLPLGDVVGLDGKALRARANALGATPLLRPEDGAWDKRDKNLFWFATTDKIDGQSQLFRMDFDNARQPEKGGKYQAVLTAHDIGGQMFDNIEADSDGRILLNEDPGKDKSAAGIWLFDPKYPNQATRLFDADAKRFVDQANAKFMTQDEEQSGIVEVTEAVQSASWFDAKKRYYLGVAQAHLAHPDPELVEYGQLYLISGPASER